MLRSQTENYTYDSLNRLTQSAIVSGATKTVTYDAIGNILTKSDVGTYTYNTTRLHAVASISGTVNTSFTYDGNGNMTAPAGPGAHYCGRRVQPPSCRQRPHRHLYQLRHGRQHPARHHHHRLRL